MLHFLIRGLALLMALLIVAAPLAQGAARLADFVDGDMHQVEHPDWFLSHDFLDLEENLATAIAANKQGLMLFFTTQGCSYCALFIQESLGDAAIVARLQQRFDTLGLEIFDDAEMQSPSGETLSVKDFAQREGAGMAPTLLFYDASGAQVFRAVGYQSPDRFSAMLDFVADGHYKTMTFAQHLRQQLPPQQNVYPQLRADAMFSAPPFALDRSRVVATHPLLVIFERTGCAQCEQFHDRVLADPALRRLMQPFEVVRLDAADTRSVVLTPSGEKTTPADWYGQLGLSEFPALLFFDEAGQERLRVDALVLQSRMANSLNFMLEKAYLQDWTYQRFARAQSLKRNAASPP